MDLTAYRRPLLFGGSFDPPQVAHVVQPRYVMEKLAADVVLYIPAAQSPHKLDRPPTPPHHRLAMLHLSLDDQPHARILTDELERAAAYPGAPSYTIDTVAALLPRLGLGAQPRLLIGADQLRAFHRWKDWLRLVELAEPVVMVRPPDTRENLLNDLPAPLAGDRHAWARRLIDTPVIDVSATDVRARAAADRLFDHLVRPAVAEYIAAHGLYRG